MFSQLRSVNPERIIRKIKSSKDSQEGRVLCWFRAFGNGKVAPVTEWRLFRLLYTDLGEFVLKAWTITSIITVCLLLMYETWELGEVVSYDPFLFDWIVFCLLFCIHSRTKEILPQ